MMNKTRCGVEFRRFLALTFRRTFYKPSKLIVFALAAAGLATLGVAATQNRLFFPDKAGALRLVALPSQAITNALPRNYIVRNHLTPQLRQLLSVIGNRLEQPGKERVVMAGTLSSAIQTDRPCQLILEFPQKLRLETADGVIAHDGQRTSTSKSALTGIDEKILDSLLYDTAERFFLSQSQGAARRFLGQRFRMDDGSDPKYEGPYYDIHQIEDELSLKRAGERGPKRYYFNSDTRLLERVRYETDLESGLTAVEIEIGAWQKVGDQLVPGFIRRTEKGVVAFTLTITSVTVNAKAEDGIFGSR